MFSTLRRRKTMLFGEQYKMVLSAITEYTEQIDIQASSLPNNIAIRVQIVIHFFSQLQPCFQQFIPRKADP